MKEYVKCKDCQFHSYEFNQHWCGKDKTKRINEIDFNNNDIMDCKINREINMYNPRTL